MTRLEELKRELHIIENFPCLSFNCLEQCREWYQHEIDCIQLYHSPNPEIGGRNDKE